METMSQVLAQTFAGNEIAAKRAIQTATIILEGKKSIGNEWGLGVRVQMETTRGSVLKPSGRASWSLLGSKVVGHSKRALEALLTPFGINWKEFETAFPRPQAAIRTNVPLSRIIKKLRPELQEA